MINAIFYAPHLNFAARNENKIRARRLKRKQARAAEPNQGLRNHFGNWLRLIAAPMAAHTAPDHGVRQLLKQATSEAKKLQLGEDNPNFQKLVGRLIIATRQLHNGNPEKTTVTEFVADQTNRMRKLIAGCNLAYFPTLPQALYYALYSPSRENAEKTLIWLKTVNNKQKKPDPLIGYFTASPKNRGLFLRSFFVEPSRRMPFRPSLVTTDYLQKLNQILAHHFSDSPPLLD